MLSTEKSVINDTVNGDGAANGKNTDIGYTNAAFTAVPDNLDIHSKKTVNGEGVNNSDTTIENASDVPERAQWGNSIEFLMSCISMSVGLGNIWRFPFTAYENGGGAFLIPYVIVLFIIGKPMYYLEMILGQFSSSGSVKVWELNPLLRGIGYGQMIAVVCVVSYYCSLIALTLYYLFASMNTELPWSSCKDSWEVLNCIDSKPSSSENPDFNNSLTVEQAVSSSELYFLRDVLKEKDDISDGIGNPDWRLTLYLLLAWAMIFLLLVRGVRSSGKASYFLALFPYVVLITLLIRASSLPGAGKGIKFFLEPKWEELYKPQVWYAATTQLFFSLSVGVGSITMFSSYNRFRHNIYRDALIVTSLDTVTSLLAGITIFAILGNLAHNLGVDDIGTVVKTGTTLAFISYPDAISKFDSVPQLFAIMFFFMLMVIGIGSGVALHNTIITIFCDSFPKVKYWKMAAVTSVGGFACGLIYVTPGGQWMLSLVDHFGGTFLIFALAIIEICAIFWIYGLENFCDDAEFMLNRKVTIYWRICWAVVTPGFMIIIFIYSMVELENPTYSGWEFPDSAIAAGWVLFVIGIIQLPLWGTWLLARSKSERTLWGNIKHYIKPTEKWGPKDAKTNAEWREYKREKQETRLKKANGLNHTYFQRKINIILGRY